MSLETKEHKNDQKQFTMGSNGAFLNGFGWVLRVKQESKAYA